MSSKDQMSEMIPLEKKVTDKDLKQIFWRSIPYNASFNYERQLNVGWPLPWFHY